MENVWWCQYLWVFCRFLVQCYYYISIDKEVQVVYEIIFFCGQFELEVFVYAICVV